MTVSKLTVGLKVIEAGMTVLENIDPYEQCVATTRKSFENSLCCYKDLLREKKRKKCWFKLHSKIFLQAQRLERGI